VISLKVNIASKGKRPHMIKGGRDRGDVEMERRE
jgi:hypothetical protein